MKQRTPIRRISAKRLAQLGKMPFSTITAKRKPVRKVSAKQREINAMLREKRIKRWNEGPRLCTLTDPPHRVLHFDDFVLDHKEPGQMGGGKDNSDSNLQDACWWHNMLKGSRRDWDAKQAR